MGDQNWSSVEGMILCHACYSFYGKHGTLHRVVKKLTDGAAPPATKKPNVVQSSCSYEYCSRKESKHFYHIRSGFSAGRQDWSRVLGMLLCHACYNHYSKYGSLERHEKRRRLDA